MGCFCCKTACFFLFGLALSPTDSCGPEGPEQEVEKVKGEAEENKASLCLAGLLWQCRKIQVSRDFSVGQASFACFSSVSSHKHAALRTFFPQSQKHCDVELQQHRLVLVMVILLRFTLLQYGGKVGGGGRNHTAHALWKLGL